MRYRAAWRVGQNVDIKLARHGDVGSDFGQYSIPERVPFISGTASDQQSNIAMVRRKSGCLDNLHAILPTGVVSRLCVCTCNDPLGETENTVHNPWCIALGGFDLSSSDSK